MKTDLITKLLSVAVLFAGLLSSTPAFAKWYPSPTGWRGPIREAGRPWLAGYAFPRAKAPCGHGHGGYYAPRYYRYHR